MDVNLIVATIEAAAPGLHFSLLRATADGVAFVAPRHQPEALTPNNLLASHLRHMLARHCGYVVSTSLDRGELTLAVIWPAAQPLKNWADYLTPRTYGITELPQRLAA